MKHSADKVSTARSKARVVMSQALHFLMQTNKRNKGIMSAIEQTGTVT